MTCIRRKNATWTTCKCDDCRPLRLRMMKLQRTGRYRRVTAEQAWEVFERLMAHGWSGAAIASAVNVHHRTIENAMTDYRRTGYRRRFGAATAAAIVNHGRPTRGQIGATGTRRRLQALAVMGWTVRDIQERSGLPWSTLASVRNGTTTAVNVSTADRVAEVFAELAMKPGPSTQGKSTAERKGWAGPLCWDDIDDPDEQPVGMEAA